MVTVRARETFPYDGVTRVRGSAFDATTEDAKILCLIGRAEYVPEVLGQSASGEAARTIDVAEPSTPRRTYRRKDVVSE